MIGQRIVREAVGRGHAVTAVARDVSKLADRDERLKVVQGDVLDPTIASKLDGADVVISAVGTARAEQPDPSLYLRAAGSLVNAVRSLPGEAPSLIVVGGVGSLRDASGEVLLARVPEERLPEHEGQKAALDFYRTVSDVRWSYVSPPARIAPGQRTGAYRTGADELVVDDSGESSITMEDYAVAVMDEAERGQHVGRRFTVAY